MELKCSGRGDKSSRMWQLSFALAALLLAASVQAVQHFIEEPQNTNVIQGQTVELKCVIGDRKGAVQWTKDGFSLGFNRTIPGYSRYSVMSSRSNEFNLRITDTQLEDDAEYECQVLPSHGEERLQARATLTVLVPCEPPVILGYSNGSTVEVPYTQHSQELTCEARLGRPAATIDWFRDGVRVSSDIRNGIETSTNDKRETARSTLTISLDNHNQENGAVYRCQARNNAVFGNALTTYVTLSILLPPGPPELSGYDNGVINVNDTLTLRCTSRGGNPLGTLTWYRNNVPVDWSYTSSGSDAINEYTFRVRSSDNKAVYSCRVTNLVVREPLKAEYELKVNFPPTSVTISGQDEPVRVGYTITLTCVTSNSNPPANITWFSKNRQIPESQSTESFKPSPEGGFITTSTVRVNIDSQIDKDIIFTCRASNQEFGLTVADTFKVTIHYPPNPPYIKDYKELVGQALKVKTNQTLTCMAVGGHPKPDFKWYKGDTLIPETNDRSLGTVAISSIEVYLAPDDNGAVYTCKVSNVVTPVPLEVSIRLTVNFPPSAVEITVQPPQPRVGEQLRLVCVSSSSNPVAEISWSRNDRRVEGQDLGTTDAENGGKNKTSQLVFNPTSRDHNALYKCQATNRFLNERAHDGVTLDILFKPEFDEQILLETMELQKGGKTSLNFTAYANPAVVTYALYKEGSVYSLPSRFKLSKGILNISDIAKGDQGHYMIKATNDEGFSTFNFSINVKYPAEIIDITSQLSVDQGDTVVFSCKVDANPLTADVITWYRDDFDMSRATTRIDGDTGYLSISDLTKDDSGTFKCVADNRIGSPSTKTAKLIVKFEPIIDKSPEISRSAGEKGSTTTLKCLAQGAPEVTFTWTRENEVLRNDQKYRIDTRHMGLVQYESTLKVKNLEQADYGAYMCTATNSISSDTHSIALTGTMKPFPPSNIEFVNATSNSITLTWKPGFDGGLAQSFRVRYKPTDARGYIYVDVQPYGTTIFKIKGLELGTQYEMTVLAFNSRGESLYQARGITAKTSDVVSPADISTSELQGTDEIPVIIILVVCIVGVFILTLNVGLILFFIRRRKKRMEGASDTTSHTNTFELYGSANKGDHTLYPAPSDDTRSYGTYDKSMDDFSDDYIREYDKSLPTDTEETSELDNKNLDSNVSGRRKLFYRECETHLFLPPQSDYPGSRPYSPHKIESPRMGGHKMAYIMEDHHGRQSPWTEDPYRVAHPRHKKGMYENGVPNGDIYEFKTRGGKAMNELSDRPPSRPSSRTGSSSLLSPNIVANPSYNGPITTNASINHRIPSPHTLPPSPHNPLPLGSQMRGPLV